MSGADQPGRGRSASRGRAVRNVTVPTPEVQERSPSRGALIGVPDSHSPTAAARSLDELTIGNGNGNGGRGNGGNGNGNGAHRGNGGNGNGGEGNGARGGPSYSRGEGSVGLRNDGQRRGLQLEDFDIVNSRPEGSGKQGQLGQKVNLVANYFDVRRNEDWCLYQYRCDFAPDEIDPAYARVRRGLLHIHSEKLGAHIFDGYSIYSSRALTSRADEVLEYVSERRSDKVVVKISIKLVGRVEPGTPMSVQFYNLVVRECQRGLKLDLMGRHYFDHKNKIEMPQNRLELWPGYITVMRQHERNLLLCVEITHKVVRQDHVLNVMDERRYEIQGRGGNMNDVKNALHAEICGTIVMTRYNRKTYKVDDIIWTEKPTSTFPHRDGDMTYIDYYKNRYDVGIEKTNQPLLVSNPKKRDVRSGRTGPIKLVPELCFMTGLNETMKSNFRLMKDIGQHTFQPPHKKVESIERFIQRIRGSQEVKDQLVKWGLDILPRPIQVPGRVLPKESIIFSDGRGQKTVDTDDKADFTMAFRSCKMPVSVHLKTWVIIVPQREAQNVDNMVRSMVNVARPMGFAIDAPQDTVSVNQVHGDAYSQAITTAMNRYGDSLQMIFVILATNKVETYSAVKKRCNIDFGVPSQCFLAKNLTSPRGLMSIVTKVAIQMNAKLGGEPWTVHIPLKNMMIVGFDVYHGSPGSRDPSIGAMVCTTNASYGRYFSTMSFHEDRDEVSTKIAGAFSKCLLAYRKVNGVLPDRVIFYRDGVGEGQLHMVFTVELEALKRRLEEMYNEAQRETAKFSFIVVTKRINTKIFLQTRNGFDNPVPGTVVDDVITWPERWDFYLIAQTARQGTVGPTSYNILYERNGLDADKVQRLTYKLCHAYYNWSGTVAVPAPCQYAHKLAFLTGVATKGQVNQNLSHLLYFL